MLMTILVTFLVTSCAYGAVAWLAVRRVIRHLQGDPNAIQEVTEHVLVPLLGKSVEKKEDTDQKKPVVKNARLC